MPDGYQSVHPVEKGKFVMKSEGSSFAAYLLPSTLPSMPSDFSQFRMCNAEEVTKNLMDIHSQAELQDLCDKLGVRPEQRTKKASVAQCLADELVREMDLSKAIEHARALESAGNLQQAAAAFGAALTLQGDVLLKGLSALCFVKLSLQQNLPGKLGGKEPEELLEQALLEAREAPARSRSLEGQLLQALSEVLFAKVNKDAAAIDRAIEARQQAREMIIEGTVEGLGWKLSKAEEFAAAAAKNEADHKWLDKEVLLQRLRKLGARAEDADYINELFEAWHHVGATGEEELSVHEFLQRFLEIARKLPAKQSKQCGAPCEGGLPPGSAPLEKELVRLVSRDGKGNWSAKAAEIRDSFPEETGRSLEALWESLAPKIKQIVDKDEQMACGHSCSTCPTKHECQVHDAIKDIEDL
ncbi:unnamed protein product [Symbiodinium sp. KB8]|nr:unnamed protein product [Symbiodinium sp. KB8]